VSYKKQELIVPREHLVSPPVFDLFSVLFLCVCFFAFVCLRPVSCVPQCCQCLWIVHSWLPDVASVSGLSILDCPMLPVSLDCPFLIVPSVFVNVYLTNNFLIELYPLSEQSFFHFRYNAVDTRTENRIILLLTRIWSLWTILSHRVRLDMKRYVKGWPGVCQKVLKFVRAYSRR
jgi:hypothetical protein